MPSQESCERCQARRDTLRGRLCQACRTKSQDSHVLRALRRQLAHDAEAAALALYQAAQEARKSGEKT